MRQIIAVVSGYAGDATAMTLGEAEMRALLIRLRLARVELYDSGVPDSAKLDRLLLAAVTDIEMAVRTWYRYHDPDNSNYWLFLAWRDLHRAKQVFKRMQCDRTRWSLHRE